MNEAGVVKWGRGFSNDPENDQAWPAKNSQARSAKNGQTRSYKTNASQARRLTPPPFLDEEVDREEIVLKPRRTSQADPYTRTNPITSRSESNGGGVRLRMSPAAPAASTSEEPEKPKKREPRPGFGVENLYVPRVKRGSGASRHPTTAGGLEGAHAPGLDTTGLDTSKLTRPTPMQTLKQALAAQPIEQPIEQHEQPILQHEQPILQPIAQPIGQPIANDDQPSQRLAPTSAPNPIVTPRSETQARPSRAPPASTEVLAEALKSLPPKAPRGLKQKGPNAPTRNTSRRSTPAKNAPAKRAPAKNTTNAKEKQKGHHQPDQSAVGQVSSVSVAIEGGVTIASPEIAEDSAYAIESEIATSLDIAKTLTNTVESTTSFGIAETLTNTVESTTSRDIGETSTNIMENTTSLDIEEISTNIVESTTDLDIVTASPNPNPNDDLSTTEENFEPYQLGLDERFASESSDESESVTSTIRDYEDVDVSDEEAASGADQVPKTRKPRKPKPIETSDGKVYYPVAVGEDPYVPLSYEISVPELTKLLSLRTDSKQRVWSHKLYSLEGKEITVECCSTLEEIETGAQKYLNEKAIGFDMEWLSRPSKHVWDNVSLIQVAKEDHITLFHLARLKKSNVDEIISPSLRKIIESKDILKVGVHIGGDGSRVKKWLGIEPQGLMELSALHHVIQYARERRKGTIPKILVSLTKLCELYLQLPIAKGSVRISDWTKPLSPSQISYAATDAYAGLRIFDALQKARMLIDPIPMLPSCVKCSEEKKKGVVTPKLYIDGVEVGTSAESTWNTTQTTFETTIQDNEVLDWADEFEATVAAPPRTPATRPRRSRNKKATAQNTDANGETPTKGKATARNGGANGETTAKGRAALKNTANGETPTKGRGSRNRAPPKVDSTPISPEMQFATDWAKSHQAVRKVGNSQAAQLKAYALWHFKEFSVEDTASQMKIFPGTAAGYISTAVWKDKLQHDTGRLEDLKSQYPPVYRARRF